MLVANALHVVITKAVLEQRRTLERLDRDDACPVGLLQMIARCDRARRTRRRGERRQTQIRTASGERLLAHRLEHMPERPTGHHHMAEMIPELGELVEYEVLRIEPQLVAGVVDLLDVRLGASRADDILCRVLTPTIQPIETLLTHALRQDRHPAARHDPTDRDATARVVPRRRPHRPMARRIELPSHHPRSETRVGGEHLVRGDHREPVAEHHDDRARHAGQRWRQHHMFGDRHPRPSEIVVPVHPPEIPRVGTLRIGITDCLGVIERRRISELGELRQTDAALTETSRRIRDG